MNQILGKKCMEWILIKIMNSSVINLVILLSVSNMSQGSVIGQYHTSWEEGDDSLNRLLAGLNMTYPVNWPSSVVQELCTRAVFGKGFNKKFLLGNFFLNLSVNR